jgi:hypothetical protein
MRQRLILVLAIAALAACKGESNTAMIENINRGTAILLEPQPILEGELAGLPMRSGGCVFSPANGGHGAMALAMQKAGYMKFDGKIVQFMADSGSTALPHGARRRYFGLAHIFVIETDGKGDGKLTVEDAQGHIAFESEGKVWCAP